MQLGSVCNRFNFLAQPFWNSLEADFQSFKDVMLLRSNLTALHAFFEELFGE